MKRESPKTRKNDEDRREEIDRELVLWKDSLRKENIMLEKLISSLEALEEKNKNFEIKAQRR